MNNALTVHRMLLESGIRHEIVQLPRTITSADQLPAVLALPARRCLAVRVYEADGGHAAIIVRPDWPSRPGSSGRSPGGGTSALPTKTRSAP